MKRVKKKRSVTTKVEQPNFKYKTACDICGKRANKTKKIDIISFMKRGEMRAACRKHLRRVSR